MRKIFVLLVFTLAVVITGRAEDTSGIWFDYRAENFSRVNTENKTLTITTAEELALLAYHVYDTGLYRDYTITLGADLDMSGHFWIPIGLPFADYEFTGTFDGQGHAISNLDIWVKQQKDATEPDPGTDLTPNGNVAGLFGKIGSGGVVKDVNVNGPYVGVRNPSASCCIGGIAGINDGTIVGCGNAAIVSGGYSADYVGGIAGENNGTIQNCYNLGNVGTSVSDNHIGGLVGDNKGTVSNCFTKCTVTKGESVKAYPIIGNGNLASGSFYANGTVYDGSSAPIELANASDNTDVLSTNNGQTKHVLLGDRTLFADGDWNTLCLPFSIPAGALGYSPIAGASVMELESTSFASGTLTLNFANAASIEAGKPYIVKWSNTAIGNLSNPVFQNMKVSNTANSTHTPYADFVGCFSPVTICGTSYLYLGTNNTLYYPSVEMAIPSCRAYFQLNGITAGEPGAGVRAFVLDFDDDKTSGIVNAQWPMVYGQSESWFTIDGLRLSGKPTKNGIYINGGKKVLIRK